MNTHKGWIISALLILLTGGILVACGTPEAEPLTPTVTSQLIDTSTPTPTSSPIATPMPSPTATPLPTATPSPTATEVPRFTLYPEPGIRIDARTYGGAWNDCLYDILPLADGGTLIAGQADNTGPSARISPGKARLIRTDSQGDVIWMKDYGGEADAMLYSLVQVGEDEYVALGQIAASHERDEMDMVLIKIDGEGNEIWSHTYGGRGMDHAKMVRRTSDGGYILAGTRADEFPTGMQYEADIVLVKTDAEGNPSWTRTYGDTILDVAWGVEQLPHGGYILVGYEAKTHEDRDVIAIKIDELGRTEWTRTWDLDPGERDAGYDLILTSDGKIVIACIQSMNIGPRRAVLIKVDLEGNEVWKKRFGADTVGNEFWDIMEDGDGGYVMAGAALPDEDSPTGGDVRHGLIIKTDPNGEILWQHVLGGDEYDDLSFSSAAVSPDGGYVFVGRATRKGERYADMLWLKLTTAGHLIAFTSERDGNSEIYTMGYDGSTPSRLSNDPAYDGWPTWSPDGSQIAFMSDRSGNPDIFVMDADGSNVRQLTQHSANDIWPEWSPDGTRIAFPSRRDGNFEIYLINPDGTHLQRLTHTPSHEDFPAWSPDGTQILFSRVEGNDGTYVVNTDGSGEKKLLDFRILEPAWSPDGTQVAFGSDHEGFRAIYVMDAEGGNLRKLSNTRAGENCPTWSPDGTRIAFASWRDGDGEIYVMGLDGSNLQKLTDNRFEEELPAWQPGALPLDSRGRSAEYPTVTFGGPLNDRAFDVLITDDGGALIAGLTDNTGLSHRIMPGRAWLIRTDTQGAVIWERAYGGENDAFFSSIAQAGDDEYVILGQIAASYTRNETDLYLVKVDGQGDEIWSRTFGGRGMDLGQMVRQTADGGYILVGDQADEHATGNVYQSNIYLIKTDAEGNMVWSQTYGDQILYLGWAVAETPDGGYVLTGWEAKTIDDRDVIAIKTNEMGEVEWSRTWDLGPRERDGGFDLILTDDGTIVIACIQSMGSGRPSAVLLKLDLQGNEIWSKLIGEEGVGNTFWHIVADVDGGYVMAGDTHLGKASGTRTDVHGAWMVKTDTDGKILWQQVFGRGEYEQAHFLSAAPIPTGGYIFVGDVTRYGESYSDIIWMRVDE